MNCNFQIMLKKLNRYSKDNFKQDLLDQMQCTGKFLYKLYFNDEFCRQTGYNREIELYIGKTTDLADRIYRHFKGMDPSYAYHDNMEKGRRIYKMSCEESLNVSANIRENLYRYIEVEVHDLTDTNVDLECYEAEQMKYFKLRHGALPVLNKREEKTSVVSLAKVRKFYS